MAMWPIKPKAAKKKKRKALSPERQLLYRQIFIGVIIWIGIDNYQLFFYMITFLLILPLSYLLRKYDTMPLIFAFLIHDRVFELSLRTVDLYFS